ncbi:hypothetical protein [Streptomyces sp. G45]|uniref:hypothetical protein n=1 Tax=Streptomyces sp. G45 TaxID=3406627 RepID=UPI003C24141C
MLPGGGPDRRATLQVAAALWCEGHDLATDGVPSPRALAGATRRRSAAGAGSGPAVA